MEFTKAEKQRRKEIFKNLLSRLKTVTPTPTLSGYRSPTPSGSTEARSVRNRIHFRYQSQCDNNLPTSSSRTNPFSYKSDDFPHAKTFEQPHLHHPSRCECDGTGSKRWRCPSTQENPCLVPIPVAMETDIPVIVCDHPHPASSTPSLMCAFFSEPNTRNKTIYKFCKNFNFVFQRGLGKKGRKKGKNATDYDVVGDETENNSANPQNLVVENQHINPPEAPELMANADYDALKKPVSIKSKPRSPVASTSKDGVITCPACEEEYYDPPTEEWIQCCECQEWWHEECSNYENSIFICDYC
ncbi:uncharacterized protein TNCV_4704101 [Trichonephila clavipes]|nr:uncharacterized protein TNCV_4704101 [Trichonephila clavipes]